MMEEFLDARSKRWVNFGRIWNEIILKLRDGDLLSNNERDILLFTDFHWLSKPTYLPLNGLPTIIDNLSSIVNSLKGVMKTRGKNMM